MSNYRSPAVKSRDDELMALYPHVPTYELAERFGISEDAVRSRAKYFGVQKLTGCRRKPMTKADRTKPREPVEEIAPVSQEPDAAGRALISKGIDPCSLAAEIVGIISGVEQAERERARQERIEAERAPCASKKKEAIAEAISHLSGVKLLVLDRVDVLDFVGREDLLYWLDGLAEDGEIETALLFATLKALPAALPDSAAAVWIENGTAGLVREAA